MTDIRQTERTRGVMLRCFVAAATAACASTATSWMQPVLMHDLSVQRGLNEAAAGGVLTIEGVAMGISSMLAARFVRRQQAQTLALVGMAFSILFSLASLAAGSVVMLYATRFLVGIGLGATVMISNIVAANFADPDKTFARIGLVNLGFGAVAVAAYSQLQRLSLGITPYAFLLISLVVALPLMMLLPRFSAFDRAGTDWDAGAAPTEAVHVRTILLSLVTLSISLASGILWSLYAIIGTNAGLAMQQVNDAIALSIFTGFMGMLLPAMIGSRMGRIVPFLSGLLCLVMAVIILASGPGIAAFRVAICINVAAIYFVLPYVSGAAARIDGGGSAAAYVGGAFYFANSASPFVAGVLVSTVGIHFLTVAIVAIAVVSAAVFIRVERLSNRLTKNREDVAAPAMAGRAVDTAVEPA